jgi:DNA-binding GntR family transcriptional regulator
MTAAASGSPRIKHSTKSTVTNRTSYVLARLREDIASGVIEPGSSIRQIELGVRYGVSATPVREALRLLESDGVIVYTAHRGATLRQMTNDDADDLFMLRAEIEGLATRICVARIDETALDRLHDVQQVLTLELAGEQREQTLVQLNRDFHFAIYDAGSRVISSQIRSLWSLRPPADAIWSDTASAASSTTDHEAILHAIEAGEADAARALMSAHIFRGANFARSRATERFASRRANV